MSFLFENNISKFPQNNPKRQIIASKRHIIDPTWVDSPPACPLVRKPLFLLTNVSYTIPGVYRIFHSTTLCARSLCCGPLLLVGCLFCLCPFSIGIVTCKTIIVVLIWLFRCICLCRHRIWFSCAFGETIGMLTSASYKVPYPRLPTRWALDMHQARRWRFEARRDRRAAGEKNGDRHIDRHMPQVPEWA